MKTLADQSLDDSDDAETLIIRSLAKIDAFALGAAIGTLLGTIVFVATNLLIVKGGEEVGPNLALLSHYFIGYEVTVEGSLIGLFYGFVFGYITGWLIASLRNACVAAYLRLLTLKNNVSAINDFIDNP